MEPEKYIEQKVKLFTNRRYFQYFSNMLLDISKNASSYIKCRSLSKKIDGINESIITPSKWYIVFQIIFNKINYNPKNLPILNKSLTPKVNYLVYCYLKKLCKKKLKILLPLAYKENTSFSNIIHLYLDLCEQKIFPEKFLQKKKLYITKNTIENIKHSKFSKTLGTSNNNQYFDSPKMNINDVHKKYGIGKKKLSYNNSLSRLFIGDTDENTVRLKYLSNISVKKEQKLNIKKDCYVKNILSDVYNSGRAYNGIIVDQDMVKVLDKFNQEQKFMDDYKKKEKSVKSNSKKKILKNFRNKFKINPQKSLIKSFSGSKINNDSCNNNKSNFNTNNIYDLFKKNKDKIKISLDYKNSYSKIEDKFLNKNTLSPTPKITGKFFLKEFDFKKKDTQLLTKKINFYDYFGKNDFFFDQL